MNATETKKVTNINQAVELLEELEDGYILVTLDDVKDVHVQYNTEIITMAQTAVLTLRLVKQMLDDPETTQEEKEAVALILGMGVTDVAE